MKLMIASDLHGSAYYTQQLQRRYEQEKPEKLILLGDILYHGPRNDLPRDYAPKQVIEMLNPLAGKILCVRGNCDCEVDQMVLKFPVLADYGVLFLQGRTVYLTHGHVVNTKKPLPFSDGDILLHGHTHVPVCEQHGNYCYLNPGSVSIPKQDSRHSYMVYEDGRFCWLDLMTGERYMEYRL
ncbi:MAG: phosphodiesterase [Oscillospiraceae bacterium]